MMNELETKNQQLNDKWLFTAFTTAMTVLCFTFFIFPLFILKIPQTVKLFSQLSETWKIFLTSVPHQLLMLISIPLAAVLTQTNRSLAELLGFRNWHFSYFLYVPALELVLFPFVSVVLLVFRLIMTVIGITPEVPVILKILQSCSNESFLIIAVSAAVIAPIAEEIIFRHAIFNYLRLKMGTALAAVTCSLLFASVHMDIVQFPGIFVLGLTFQLLYVHFKSLYPCIMLHVLHNSISLTIFLILRNLPKLMQGV